MKLIYFGSISKVGENNKISSKFAFLKKNKLDTYIELLKLVLPELLIEHFELVKNQTINETLHIYFEEKKQIPTEFNHLQIVSKGFLNEITIEDFPLRGKYVYLHVKRRRWTDKVSGAILQRDWNLVAKGTRMTSDFAAFLKEINRY